MSAGVWYGKRTWLGLGFALVLALALDALGALLLARGMVPMAAALAAMPVVTNMPRLWWRIQIWLPIFVCLAALVQPRL